MSESSVRVRPFDHPASGQVRTGTLYQAGEATDAPRPVVVVVHGLFVDRAMREIDLFCRLLATGYDVVSVDMRGHGDGPGAFTWGREEHRDLADLVAFLRALYPAVGMVGFSFGGDVAIFSAAMSRDRDDGARPDALCTIGSPAHMDLWRFRIRPFGFLAHLGMVWRRKRRRFVPGWPHLRWKRAVDVVAAVSPVPLLIIHGERDWLVHPQHAKLLYEAAAPPRELILIERGLHAEYIVAQNPDLLLDPIREFFDRFLRAGPSAPAAGEVSVTRGRS